MIEDFNTFSDGSSFQADVCIIGAGAAGITTAREFLGTRHKILLLEGGGLDPEVDSRKLFESEVAGLPHISTHDERARLLGGTTTLWEGQALRFDDFELRERTHSLSRTLQLLWN